MVLRSKYSESSWLSMPITEMSSGTFSPASRMAWEAPIAISSDPAKIAVGRVAAESRLTAGGEAADGRRSRR